MKIVSATYARAHLPKLLDAASRGEHITIARHRKPVGELGPLARARRPMPILGGVKGIRVVDRRWAEPMTKQEIEAMLGDRY